MERVLDRCAGLDVHKKTVTVCVRVPDTSGGRTQHVRTVATTTAELLMLEDWLETHRVSHVARESTGVYWRPVFYVLEEACTCVIVYQMYRYYLHPSIEMIALSILDLIVIALTWPEYRQLKRARPPV